MDTLHLGVSIPANEGLLNLLNDDVSSAQLDATILTSYSLSQQCVGQLGDQAHLRGQEQNGQLHTSIRRDPRPGTKTRA